MKLLLILLTMMFLMLLPAKRSDSVDVAPMQPGYTEESVKDYDGLYGETESYEYEYEEEVFITP